MHCHALPRSCAHTQIAAQEVSTMLRYGVNPLILLLNNGGYTIEARGGGGGGAHMHARGAHMHGGGGVHARGGEWAIVRVSAAGLPARRAPPPPAFDTARS